MVKILFLGRLGDVAGGGERELAFTPSIASAAALRDSLGKDCEELARALAEPQVMVAVNQQLTGWDAAVAEGDEVAFLPPVSGG